MLANVQDEAQPWKPTTNCNRDILISYASQLTGASAVASICLLVANLQSLLISKQLIRDKAAPANQENTHAQINCSADSRCPRIK